VLELLPPAERRDFERRLAADPALRALVRELQGNVDALVLAEPAPPAPVQVWGRIAAEVKASEAPLLAFPEGVRASGANAGSGGPSSPSGRCCTGGWPPR
jgi:anti-sigma-K factor RskA